MDMEKLQLKVRQLNLMIDLLSSLLPFLDLAAAAVFAVTGALVASRKQMDIVGFLWLGTITGVGGGTVRDLFLGLPVFWVANPTPLVVCIFASAIVFVTAHLVHSRYNLILWLDAIGLSLVTVAGTAKGLDTGAGPVVAIVMGVITAAVGGVIRDIIGQEPSIILRREIYVTASVIGAIAYVVLIGAGLGRHQAAIAAFLTVFVVRGFAITFHWALPTYRARAGKVIEKRPDTST